MSVSRFKFSVKPQEAILILITMFWGGTFLAVQYAVTLSDPFFFVGLRFATAALAVGLISLKTLRGLTLKELKAGVAIGVAIAMGYSLQTWGLQTISSSKSAFITAMYVPLVPLLQWLCLGRLPGLMSCIGIVLAFIGLILLAGPENNLLALGLGIFSAIIQVTMNWAQRSVSPTRATVIYTGEPVWAGIFGRLAGERLPLLALVGAAFIVAGVLVSELKLRKRRNPVSDMTAEEGLD